MWDLKKHRANRRLRAFEYLGGAVCKDCGNNDARVLEFDHVRERRNNRPTIAAMLGGSWSALVQELEKCEIVCANCHKIRQTKEVKHVSREA